MSRVSCTCLYGWLLAAILFATGDAQAQLAGPTLMHPSPAPQKKAPSAEKPVKACPEYGAGYRRLEGTGTCVKIGGYVRMQGGLNSR
jgi:hypothetical protein